MWPCAMYQGSAQVLSGHLILLRIPRCWCGQVLPIDLVAAHCKEYGRCAKQIGSYFVELFETAVIGACPICNKWRRLLDRDGPCTAAGEIDFDIYRMAEGMTCASCTKSARVEPNDMLASHMVNRNPLFPTACQGCDAMYVHDDEHGNAYCSHTTCQCGYQQCKVCLATFVDTDGVMVKMPHYSFPRREVVAGSTVCWYPAECTDHD